MGGKILQNRSSRLKSAKKKRKIRIPHRRAKPFLKSREKKIKKGAK
jgi:hypothetical protein